MKGLPITLVAASLVAVSFLGFQGLGGWTVRLKEVDGMNEILLPVLIAGIGLLCGLGLAIASIVMAVPKDEKAEAIEEILPGANCGACGYSGCAGYAKALSSGEAPVAYPGRRRGGAAATAELLGVAAYEVEYKTALVHCMGFHDNTTDRMKYQDRLLRRRCPALRRYLLLLLRMHGAGRLRRRV